MGRSRRHREAAAVSEVDQWVSGMGCVAARLAIGEPRQLKKTSCLGRAGIEYIVACISEYARDGCGLAPILAREMIMTVQFSLTDLGGDTLARATALALDADGFGVSDFIGRSDPNDVYRFTLGSPQAVEVALSLSNKSAAAQLQLYDGSGRLVTRAHYEPDGAFLAGMLSSGTYYLAVSSADAVDLLSDADTGYRLTLSTQARNDGSAGHSLATAKALGSLSSTATKASDRFDAAAGSDVFSFRMTASGIANIALSGLRSGADVSLSLRDDLGRLVAMSSASGYYNGLISQQLATGTYYLSVSGQSAVASGYSLVAWSGATKVGTASADGAGATLTTARSLGTLSTTATSYADYIGRSGDTTDTYRFAITSASRVSLDLLGLNEQSWTNLQLLDANGNAVRWITGGSGVVILAKGTYYAQVMQGFGETGYAIKASASAIPNAIGRTRATATSLGTLTATPVSRSDFVGSVTPDDFYSFKLTGNSRVGLRLIVPDGGGHATLTLMDASGQVLGTREWTGAEDIAVRSSVHWDAAFDTVLGAGTYYVQVHSDDQEKYYQLGAVAVTGPDGSAGHSQAKATSLGTLGATAVARSDWVGRAAPTDFYSFKLAAYSTVNLFLDGDTAALPNLRLLASDGSEIAYLDYANDLDAAKLTRRLGAGTYYVAIDQEQWGEGAYSISASAVPGPNGAGGKTQAAATALPGGISSTVQTLTDTVGAAAGAEDWYKFTLTKAQVINFLPIGANTVSIDVYGPDGWIDGGFSGGAWSASREVQPGTYYVKAYQLYGSSGATTLEDYSLRYWTGAPATGSSSTDNAGGTLATARNLGTLSQASSTAVADWIGVKGSVSDAADVYKFTLSGRSIVDFTLAGAMSNSGSPDFIVYDASGKQLHDEYVPWLDGTQVESFDLDKGTYYLKLANTTGSVSYRLSARVKTAIADKAGDTRATAYDLGTIGTSAVSVADYFDTGAAGTLDVFKFGIGTSSTISFDFDAVGDIYDWANFSLYDEVGNEIDTWSVPGVDGTSVLENLSAGTYYLSVNTDVYGLSGPYTLSLRGTAAASTPKPPAPGTGLSGATPIGAVSDVPRSVGGWVGLAMSEQYYGFTLDADGYVSVRVAGTDGAAPLFSIVDAGGALEEGSIDSSAGTQVFYLTKGTHYVRVESPSYGDDLPFSVTVKRASVVDQAGHSLATAKTIALSASSATIRDSVFSAAGPEYFKFTLASKQVVNLRLTGDLGISGYRILDSAGNLVAEGQRGPGATAFTLNAGSYYLEVDGFGRDVAYALTTWTGAVVVGSSGTDGAGATMATAASLGTLTTTAVARADWLGSGDPTDMYKFVLSKTSRLTLGFSGLTPDRSLTWSVVDSTGQELFASTSDSIAEPIDLLAGSYYLKLGAGPTNTPYRMALSATALPDAAGKTFDAPKALGALGATAVSVSDAVYRRQGVDGDDYYSFTISSPRLVTLGVTSLDSTNGSSVWLNLKDSLGQDIDNAFLGPDGTMQKVLQAGTYRFSISATTEGTDLYTVSAKAEPAPDGGASHTLEAAKALPTLLGTAALLASDTVNPGYGEDFYTFKLAKASTVRLELDMQSGSGVVGLMTAAGGPLESGYAVDPECPGSVVVSLAAGSYAVRVTGAGSYRLLGAAVASPDGSAGHTTASATVLTPQAAPKTVSDSLSGGAPRDVYKITLASAGRVNLNLASDSGAPITLSLQYASGASIQDSYIAPGGSSAGISRLLAAGTYYVAVSQSADNALDAAYVLTYATGETATGTSAAVDTAGAGFSAAKALGAVGPSPVTTLGWIGSSDTTDIYSFSLDADSLAAIVLGGAKGSVWMEVYDASGSLIDTAQSDGYGAYSFRTRLAAGSYYLKLATTAADVGYSLSLATETTAEPAGRSPATARDLGLDPAGKTAEAKLVGTEERYYRFSLSSPTYVDLTVRNASASVRADLLAPDDLTIPLASFTGSPHGDARYGAMLAAGDHYVRISGASAGVGSYTLEVRPATLSIAAASVTEGNSGTAVLTYVVSLSAPSSLPVTVGYATANGSATAGSDYVAQSGMLTIAAGQTSGTVSILVKGDTAVEGNETLKLTLSGAAGAVLAGGASAISATGTIRNDDTATARLAAFSAADTSPDIQTAALRVVKEPAAVSPAASEAGNDGVAPTSLAVVAKDDAPALAWSVSSVDGFGTDAMSRLASASPASDSRPSATLFGLVDPALVEAGRKPETGAFLAPAGASIDILAAQLASVNAGTRLGTADSIWTRVEGAAPWLSSTRPHAGSGALVA